MIESVKSIPFIKLLFDRWDHTKRERAAVSYLFFDSYRNHLFLLLPLFFSTFFFYLAPEILIDNDFANVDVEEFKIQIVRSYLLGFKIAVVIICSFMVAYRWGEILKDGNYGYWLSLGIDRRIVYTLTTILIVFRLFFMFLLGFAIISISGGLKLETLDLIMLILLTFSSILFMVSFAIILAELIDHALIAGITLSIVYGAHLFFNQTFVTFVQWLLIGEFEYSIDRSLALFRFLVTMVVGGSFIYAGFILHNRHDIEL